MSAEQEQPVISTILERFRQTQARIEAQAPTTPNEPKKSVFHTDADDAVKAEGLSAIPQPEMTSEDLAKPDLEWPVKPQFIDPQSTEKFADLGVSELTCRRLQELGMPHAFAVQTAIIPRVLACQRSTCPDPPAPILVNSFTGSGKTLAYSVPIVDLLRSRRVARTRALILLPTKVLIQQVHHVLEQLSSGTPIRIMSLKTDRTLSKEIQLIDQEVPDVIISAPGRLVEHLALRPNLLQDLQLLVVDEADRLVGQSFQNWTSTLAEKLPLPSKPVDGIWNRSVQRLIFSATLTRDPSKLNDLQISTTSQPALPELYVVGAQDLDGKDEFALPQQLHERLIKVPSLTDKPLVLTDKLLQCDGRVIVFVQSNESAARLSRLINLVASLVYKQSVEARPCSGEMRPQDRRRVLRDFAEETSGVLVCTDLIARGIDMHIDYVINYDVPLGAREYVHRVGRTARAGVEGSAWTLATPGFNTKRFWEIQATVGRSAPITEEESVQPEHDEEAYKAALHQLGEEVMGH